MKQFYTRFKRLFIINMSLPVLLLISLFMIPSVLMAQLKVTNKGAEITIRETPVYINGSYEYDTLGGNSFESSSIYNEGSLYLSDSLVNKTQKFLFSGETGLVVFNGSQEQVILSPSIVDFYRMSIRKPGNNLVLHQSIRVLDSLAMQGGNLFLGDFRVDFGIEGLGEGSGKIFQENNDSRIYTGPTGKGTLRTWIDIESSGNTYYPGNLGLGITSSTNYQLGMTEISRGHGPQKNAGSGGIARYYDITPEISAKADAVTFQYFEKELTGQEESSLGLWYSADRGNIWKNKLGLADPVKDMVNKEGNSTQDAEDPVYGFENQKEFSFSRTARLTVGPKDCVENPLVDLGAPVLYLCSGGTTILDAGNPGMFYQWSGSASDTTRTIEVSEAGIYRVYVTNAHGCTGTAEIQVMIKDYPVASFTAAPVCIGEETVFKNASAVNEGRLTYFWNFGVAETEGDTSIVENPVFLYEAPGVYDVKLDVTSQYGCTHSFTKKVVISALPDAAFSYNNACLDQSIDFSNESILNSEGLTYRWTFGDGGESTLENPSHAYTKAGDYEVKLVVRTNEGCEDSVIHTLSVYQKPVPDFKFTSVCKGESIALANTSVSDKKLSYTWDFGDGTTSALARPSKTYAEAGFYTITLTATTAFGCHESISKEVGINGCLGPEPVDCSKLSFQADLGPDQELCPGSFITLDPGEEGFTYLWSDHSAERTLKVEKPGTYWVEIMSEQGCMSKDYITISSLSPLPENEIMFCQGGGLTLDAGNPGSTYSWNSDQGVAGSERTLSVIKPGRYWLTVARGGCSLTDTIRVRETSNAMTANFLSASLADVGDTIQFVQVSDPEPTEFYWSFSDGVTSKKADPSHIYYRPGDYEVMLISSNGVCSDTLTKIITVRPLRKEETEAAEAELFTEIMLLKAYPNPTTGTLNLQIELSKETEVSIAIYSMNGVVMNTKNLQGKEMLESFDLSHYGKGMYIVRVIAGHQVKFAKIIKL